MRAEGERERERERERMRENERMRTLFVAMGGPASHAGSASWGPPCTRAAQPGMCFGILRTVPRSPSSPRDVGHSLAQAFSAGCTISTVLSK